MTGGKFEVDGNFETWNIDHIRSIKKKGEEQSEIHPVGDQAFTVNVKYDELKRKLPVKNRFPLHQGSQRETDENARELVQAFGGI